MSYEAALSFPMPAQCRTCCGTGPLCCGASVDGTANWTGDFSGIITTTGVTLSKDNSRLSPANTHPWFGQFTFSGHTLRVWFYCVPGQIGPPFIPFTYTFLIWCDFDVNAFYDGFYAAFGCFAGDACYNPACDFNHNGFVGADDQFTFNLAFGSSTGDPNYNPACDFDHNGHVDTADLFVFNQSLNCRAPDPCYNAVYDYNHDGFVSSADVPFFISDLEGRAFGAGFGDAVVTCPPGFDVAMTKTMGGFSTCWGASGVFNLEVH